MKEMIRLKKENPPEVPAASSDTPVQEYLLRAAELWPEKEAVRDGRKALRYGEILPLANRLAHALADRGVGRGDRVLLGLPRSTHWLSAMAGVLQAGAAYVPLDPKSPLDRWQKIAEDCSPRAALCDPSTAPRLHEILPPGVPVICLCQELIRGEAAAGPVPVDLYAYPDAAPECGSRGEDVAYVLYTSGSTGSPKGVMITHDNIRNYIDWAVRCFDMSPEDRILGTAPFHFDMSTFDIWATFAAGGTLCLAGDQLTLFPEKLLRFMEEEKVTLWKGISSLLMYLERSGVLRPGRLPHLTRVLFGGETLPTRYLLRWMETFPEKTFYNVYGPTEATGISMYYPVPRMPDAAERIPIGIPCRGARVRLLDDDFRPVSRGEVGELFIGGPGVGRGYLNDPEKTARAFLPDPVTGDTADRWYRTGDLVMERKDGFYEFVGRKDHQVKIMGYRIELAEIEHALLALPGVHDGTVMACPGDKEGFLELIAYFEGEREIDEGDLLAELKVRLPAYMVPRRFVRLERIPRGGRGKIDREALRSLQEGRG